MDKAEQTAVTGERTAARKGNHIHVTSGNGSRQVFTIERVKDDKGGYYLKKSVPNGHEFYSWTAEIDMTLLEQMAFQAARNKSGKSVDGPLVVTITRRVHNQ